jgi:hypothetical protein
VVRNSHNYFIYGALIIFDYKDDSIPAHSSPIRGHVNRKLSRTTSSATTESHRSGLHRSQSDELQDAVKLAVGNLDVIGSLDSGQLAKLREMLTVLNGKVEDAISGNKHV